jgi:CheY-like chemotaxis protein
MPEMDGAALLREIKADARLSRLPVVLLTSIPQHAEANGILRDGFAACLTKPIRQAQLLGALLDVVRESKAGAPRPRLFFRPRGETGEPNRG